MQSHILVEFLKKVYQKQPLGKMKKDRFSIFIVSGS